MTVRLSVPARATRAARVVGTGVVVAFVAVAAAPHARAALRAGAYVQDVSPTVFPVIINGGFVEKTADKIVDPVNARAIVLDDGREKIAIVVVDSCMITRELLDDAKERAKALTGIPTDHMLISATHTHSAPSAMGCLGSDADPNYVKTLPALLARAIEEAHKRLAPARAGWAAIDAPDHTACRRYIFRPDRMRKDPFGDLTVRANMHPGYANPDAMGPSGPEDPGLSVLSVQHADGRPLALLANYSMHYFGASPVSADYYGHFCREIAEQLNAPPEFVAAMSQGTSGDIWMADYSKPQPKEKRDIKTYAKQLAEKVTEALKTAPHAEDAPIAMRETTLKLRRRVPDEKRLAWAREKVAALNGAKPRTQPDIYAREAVILHEQPERELKLQAIRIGACGIAAIPNEVYALTGLKIKAASPLHVTFNIELANGSEGYIPPPEQHKLGGYTTWPARTAGLEEQAEPRIAEACIKLLEEVSGQPRRKVAEAAGPYVKAIMEAKPAAYFRMAETAGRQCTDVSGGGLHGAYEDGVVFHLPGAPSAAVPKATTPDDLRTPLAQRINRAAHFAGGRMTVRPQAWGGPYSVEFLVWNALAAEARPVTAYLFSRGPDGDKDCPGDHLGIGGNVDGGANAGKLIFYNGNGRKQLLAGKTVLAPRAWYHVALARDGAKVRAWVNGQLEIDGDAEPTSTAASLFLGGRCDGFANLEGRLDEVALYRRALADEEVAAHFKAAELPAPKQADAKSAVGSGQSAVPTAGDGQLATDNGPRTAAFKRAADPLSPDEAIKKIHVSPDLVVERVACEPIVIDPVAIDWGPDGRLWVVEMADYPYGMDGKGKPGGRVKFLTDSDGDGVYDKATLFLDGLQMPNGVLAWRGGVLITAAPDVLYAEDTDGDGKADKTQVLYKGFKEGNPQLRINALRWGLDNWVYLANGLSGGVVESVRTGLKLDIRNRDLRIRPDTGGMELASGPSQYGRAQDDWGRWFGTHNAQPLFHFVYEDRYLKRNPSVTYPDARNQLMPLPLPPLFPRSPFAKRYIGLDHHGHFTSGCGISVYRDDVLFAAERKDEGGRMKAESRPGTPSGASSFIPHPSSFACAFSAFVCDPVHNIVQRQVLEDDGASFKAHRVDGEKGADFFASEDPWCRPVMTRAGPDGAVWVVDMYRYMIEHPDWLNARGKAELAPFYRDGDDRGRLYRVYPKNAGPRAIPRLDRLSTGELVARLGSPSGHTRDQAQMMLLWKADAAAATPLLEKLATTSDNPLARLHALCALDGIATAAGKPALLNADTLVAALADAHPGVRAQAVRIAEARGQDEAVRRAAAALARDGDPKVRMQLAFTLGEWDGREADDAIATLARRAGDDPYQVAAVLSSAPRHFAALADLAASGKPLAAPQAGAAPATEGGGTLWAGLLATATAAHDRLAIAALLGPVVVEGPAGAPGVAADAARFDALARWLDSLPARGTSLARLSQGTDDLSQRLARLSRAFEAAGRVAADARAPLADRVAAAGLLGRVPARRADDLRLLAPLLGPTVPPALQAAAVKAAARTGDPAVPALLLAGWDAHSPGLRQAIADVLLPREAWALDLAGSPAARALDFSRRQRLLNHSSPRVKAAAKVALAGGPASADRQKVIDEYAPALAAAGDRDRGREVFREQCATCHRVGSSTEGHDIGPNLLTVRDWARDNLLTAILDPDRTVEPRFIAYTAALSDGQELTGIVTAEAAGTITLKTLDDKDHVLARTSLKKFVSTGRSMMPQGFEAAIPVEDAAALMAFIQDPSNR